jgi:putative FmdB family regulatory protein
MPTYEYECMQCKHRFEAFHSMTAEPIKECPECGGKVKKLIGAGAGIIFKGSGFYVTDYKGSNGNGKAAAANRASSSTDSGTEGAASASKSGSAETAASESKSDKAESA